MRIYRLVSTAIGGVFMAGLSTAAFAGCGGNTVCGPNVFEYEGVRSASCVGPAPTVDCRPGVTVHSNYVDTHQNIGIYNTAPYGHLKTVQYKNSPNVNIMRVHSRTPYVSLEDSPTSFTNGCSPTSTAYCRANSGTPVNVVFNQPAPVHTSRVIHGSGYNAAAFASRQYGSTAFVPGIAHVPTSIVDRSAITHINGIPQQRVHSVTTASNCAPQCAPRVSTHQGGNVVGSVVTSEYTYQPPGGGGYWEKTSGPTMVGGLPATQILCRREAPRPDPVTVRVVSPVIDVPAPMCAPAPVACAPRCAPPKPVCAPKCAPVKPTCRPVQTGCAPVVHAGRYGAPNRGRWAH